MMTLRTRMLALIADTLALMAASDTIEPGLMRLVADARAVIDEIDAPRAALEAAA